MTANERKRPLWSRSRSAAYSLQARARRRASSSFWPNHTPGLRIETTAVSTPALSMSSSDMATDHLVGVPLWAVRARAWAGGTMWWWTSIRRGFTGACAEGACAKGACAEAGGATENPNAVAALPDRKFRRLTGAPEMGSPATGSPANAATGSQQTHREKNPRRPACLLIMLLLAQPQVRRHSWRGLARGQAWAKPSIEIVASTIR